MMCHFSYRLPGFFLCSSDVPSLAYTSMNEADTIHILNELRKYCNGTEDPEVPNTSTQKY